MNQIAIDLASQAREKVALGWVQEKLQAELPDGTMAYCARGAIEAAHEELTEPGIVDFIVASEAEAKCLSTLWRRVLAGQDIEDWNDTTGRTQEEVVAAFDTLIEVLGSERY